MGLVGRFFTEMETSLLPRGRGRRERVVQELAGVASDLFCSRPPGQAGAGQKRGAPNHGAGGCHDTSAEVSVGCARAGKRAKRPPCSGVGAVYTPGDRVWGGGRPRSNHQRCDPRTGRGQGARQEDIAGSSAVTESLLVAQCCSPRPVPTRPFSRFAGVGGRGLGRPGLHGAPTLDSLALTAAAGGSS